MRKRIITSTLFLGTFIGSSHIAAEEQEIKKDSPPDTAAPHLVATPTLSWVEPHTIDTSVDVGRGDWFKKKAILKEAHTVYQSIQNESKDLDAYLGKLLAHYSDAIALFNKTVEEKKPTNEKFQAITKKIEEFITDQQSSSTALDLKSSLEEYNKLLSKQHELQSRFSSFIRIIQQEQKKIQSFPTQAWELHNNIDATLNEQIAEHYLSQMRELLIHMKKIRSYMDHDLKISYEKCTTTGQEIEQAIQTMFQSIEKRLLELQPPAAQNTDLTPQISPSWWSSLKNWFSQLFGYTNKQ